MSDVTWPATNSAVLSPCGAYRYLVTRRLGPGKKLATFIMLNPSTADAERDDATVRKCMGFARRWGCARLQVVYLFALRAADPAALRRVDDPVGPENAAWVGWVVRKGGGEPLVCAWDNHGAYRDQDLVVLRLLAARKVAPFAVQVTKHGRPKHPLYVLHGTEPMPFTGRRQ